jgi:cell division septum initiation protein DivIVA
MDSGELIDRLQDERDELRSENEELRAENERLREHQAKELNRRASVEIKMFDAVKAGDPVPVEQVRKWALDLGIPEEYRMAGCNGDT